MVKTQEGVTVGFQIFARATRADKGGNFKNISEGLVIGRTKGGISQDSGTLHMTFEGLGEMFKGDCADMCTRTFWEVVF